MAARAPGELEALSSAKRWVDLARSRRENREISEAAAPYRVASPFSDEGRLANLARYASVPLSRGRPWLLIGLNPGLHGQMQTGIPFTDNARLSWYAGWLPGLAATDHRRIEQSSRILYDCFAEASRSAGERLHERLLMVNAFPYCLLDAEREKHPEGSIETILAERRALASETHEWLEAAFDVADPVGVIALGSFAENASRPHAEKRGVPILRAPHPRSLLYEKANGERPRRGALVAALRQAML